MVMVVDAMIRARPGLIRRTRFQNPRGDPLIDQVVKLLPFRDGCERGLAEGSRAGRRNRVTAPKKVSSRGPPARLIVLRQIQSHEAAVDVEHERCIDLSAVDPSNAAFYDANYKKFEATINSKLQEWGAAMLPFKGQSVVAYHDSWVYFAHRFGLNIDVFLEPKPGIPPSPSHLAEVIEKMKAQKIKAIIVEPFHDRKIAEKVASSTGGTVVDFAQYPGALPGTDSYVKLIDALVSRLSAAMK